MHIENIVLTHHSILSTCLNLSQSEANSQTLCWTETNIFKHNIVVIFSFESNLARTRLERAKFQLYNYISLLLDQNDFPEVLMHKWTN